MTKILIAIVASILVGTIASIAIFENDAFAGGGGGSFPTQEETKLHGPLLGVSFSECCSPYNHLTVSVLPYPNEPSKAWLMYNIGGSDLPDQYADGCMLNKNEVNGGGVEFNSTQLVGCTVDGPDYHDEVVVSIQLVDNSDYQSTDWAGSHSRCQTQYDDGEKEFVKRCFESEGRSTSNEVGGTATVVVDGGNPIVLNLDAEEMETYIRTNAGQGKCAINYYGDPIQYFWQISSACNFFFGGD